LQADQNTCAWEGANNDSFYRTIFQKQIHADLIRRRIPFITLRGKLEERMQTVIRVLKNFDKYSSLSDNLISTR
jgi:hypothetical protein